MDGDHKRMIWNEGEHGGKDTRNRIRMDGLKMGGILCMSSSSAWRF